MAVVLTKIFVSPKMVAILNFQSFCKTQKCLYLENRAIWSEQNFGPAGYIFFPSSSQEEAMPIFKIFLSRQI